MTYQDTPMFRLCYPHETVWHADDRDAPQMGEPCAQSTGDELCEIIALAQVEDSRFVPIVWSALKREGFSRRKTG